MSTCACPMHSAGATLLFCGIFVQHLPCVVCGDLTSTDFVAIGVSLALAIFILTFLTIFYCLAQRRIAKARNCRVTGRDNISISGYIEDSVEGIHMSSYSTSQEQNRKPIYYNFVTYC